MRARHLRYFLVQTISSIVRTPLVQLIAISTITVSLTVLCSLFALTTNLNEALERWNRGLGVIVFMQPNVTDQQVADLAEELKSWPAIESVHVHDRKTARLELQKTLVDKALMDDIGADVLPVSLEVALVSNQRSAKARAQIAQKLKAKPHAQRVASVDFGSDLIKRMKRVGELVSVGSLVVGLLTLFAVVFIVTNTVRLTLFARREEIQIMDLVGATHLFIRIPFYLEGAFQGVVGAGFAMGLTWSIVQAIPKTGVLSGITGVAPELSFLSTWMVVTIIVSAGIVGIGASHVATGRFLGYGRES